MVPGKYKKTILFIVDSFNPAALERAIRKKMVPAMEFIRKRGYFSDRCVSAFPTMTPTCAASIITGLGPEEHQVPGFVWFNREEMRIVNYGISRMAVWKMGLKRVIQDLLYNLNHRQMSRKVKTLYESFEEAGFTTGAINPFIYRSGYTYQARVPLIMKLLSNFRLKNEKLCGPGVFFLGQFCPPKKRLWKFREISGFMKRFGVNDEYSGTVGRWLIREGRQPDLLTLYLPETDGYAHRHNPGHTEHSLAKADRQIAKILGSYTSWEDALKKNTIIVVGDHSQSRVDCGSGYLIDIPAMLSAYAQVELVDKNVLSKEIAVCVNERMCHIYILRDREKLLPELVKRLLNVPGVDQLAWQSGGWCCLQQAGRGVLRFRPGADFYDEYGQGWSLSGDYASAGALIQDNRIVFDEYPDALSRFTGLINCKNGGDLIITAKLGFEFIDQFTSGHTGCGSHGSLHKEDSLVPLFISGSDFNLPKPRILDLACFIKAGYGLA